MNKWRFRTGMKRLLAYTVMLGFCAGVWYVIYKVGSHFFGGG